MFRNFKVSKNIGQIWLNEFELDFELDSKQDLKILTVMTNTTEHEINCSMFQFFYKY